MARTRAPTAVATKRWIDGKFTSHPPSKKGNNILAVPTLKGHLSIRDLFPASWLNNDVLMLHAYFDDSGDNGETVMAIGGFVASVEAWGTYFEPAWEQFLKRNNLPFFRMSQFENRKGPYKEWSNEKRRREIQELLTVITRSARVGVGVAMDMEAYRRHESRMREKFGEVIHPYYLCAHWAVTMVGKWRHNNDASNKLALFFEEGTDGTGRLLETLRELSKIHPYGFRRDSPFTVGSKEDFVQLQAADIMAYETFKSARRLLGHDSRKPRKSLDALLQSGSVEYLETLLKDEYFELLLSFPSSP